MKKQAPTQTFFNIRVATATNEDKALIKVLDEKFNTRHPLSDRILSKEQLINELTENRIPNGLHSFSETLAMITSDIYGIDRNIQLFFKLFPTDKTGHMQRINEIIQWATEFETLHTGETWETSDYYDEIALYVASKLEK